jgi:hypothetical protein
LNLLSCILAGSLSGGAVVCSSTLTVTCTDVWGNTGGDWVNCLAGLDGSNGNISADPLFCDAGAGDFYLEAASPCRPLNSGCGRMGALHWGCGLVGTERATWGSVKGRYR